MHHCCERIGRKVKVSPKRPTFGMKGLRRLRETFSFNPIFARSFSFDAFRYSHKREFSTNESLKKVLIITGPTGVGKSQVGMELAKKLNGEIISADSRTVFKGMDKGTAKPSLAARAEVPHHLVDISMPNELFTAADFSNLAREALNDIERRGKVPIVVGGSPFYLKSFMEGLPEGPGSTHELETRLEQELRPLGWDHCLSMLAEVDPVSARRIVKNNWTRLFRSLAVYKETGKPFSSFLNNPTKKLERDFRCFFLTMNREQLYRNVDIRCEQMISEGLLEEISGLLERKELSLEYASARAIGYRQGIEFLSKGEYSISAFKAFLDDFQSVTRGFVHKQCNWFRHSPDFLWLNCDPNVAEKLQEGWNLSLDNWKELLGSSQARLRHLSKREGVQLRERWNVRQIFRTDKGIEDFIRSSPALNKAKQ